MLVKIESFSQDMKQCRRCSQWDCPCKKLAEFVDSYSDPEEALNALRKRIPDEEILDAFYLYLKKTDPDED